MEALKFIFSGFWIFVGFLILFNMLLYGVLNLILQIIHKNIRARTIRKVGYPPVHCDGDGDFKKENKIKL
jgi:hypothetical protein